jgi:polyribonucleotide nucleotidyltransferase
MSSNGSTSMASVCGSTLALMDAGVPIKAPVSGIAMGLIISGKDVAIMSDIMGIEDFNGDMDFKVAGTTKGVTAIQLDVKTLDLTPEILEKALQQAKVGRAEILKVVTDCINTPRTTVSQYAPKIKMIKVPTEKIGELIGPGGKAIKKLMADTNTQIDVEDDGSVSVAGVSEEGMNKAIAYIEGLTKVVTAGEIYEGEVVRIMNFGAFVNILPGKDGMVHVSDMAEGYVNDANDVVKIGDKVQVRVKEVDEMGRINLSMRMDPSTDKPKEERRSSSGDRGNSRGGRPQRGGGFNRGARSGGGFRQDRNGSSRQQNGRSSGPHFPTSRYFQTEQNPDR